MIKHKRDLRTPSIMWGTEQDPFQVFEVEHEACLDFEIKVERGECITKGSTLQDIMDTPDPYVILKIPGSSNSSKRTSHVDNCTNPIWDESFHFYLDPSKEHNLKVVLMDANYTIDESLGEDTFCVNELTNDIPTEHTFVFPGGSKIHTLLKLQKNKTPDLRFSLALCQQEKDFLQIRRRKVFVAMKKLLADKAPDTDKQVPIIGVLGSGGGFRAMTCLSGAVKALHESGILDCVTYIAGLSGSTWYISTLYAHDSFPNVPHVQVQKELEGSVTEGWKRHLMRTPQYVASMVAKYKQGQPVSLTDFFGHLLGDVLLKEQKNKKLSESQKILAEGIVPMPLYAGLHAKNKVSCRSFSEWIEFSPYEIGIAKYGTFMKTQDFGSKFIVGKKIKTFEEFPLHFLQGVWGSAFTILIKRLVMEGGKKDIVQIMRDVQKDEMEKQRCDTHSSGESSDSDDEEYIDGKDDRESEESYGETSNPHKPKENISLPQESTPKTQATEDSVDSDGKPRVMTGLGLKQRNKKISLGFLEFPGRTISGVKKKMSTASDPGITTESETSPNSSLRHQSDTEGSQSPTLENCNNAPGVKYFANRRKCLEKAREEKKAGLFDGLVDAVMTGAHMLNARAGRAGEVLSPFRGLTLRHSFPISPIAALTSGVDDQDDDVDIGIRSRYEPLDNTAKKLFIVDSGLAFNSPYPLLLRPQRAVDIYLSFDFSQRPSDKTQPFKELLLAEKWAMQNQVNFPPIEKQVAQYEHEEVRECYVFKHPTDQFCPVILHFPLVNKKFKKFKAPGVPRKTEDEIRFADFPIFDDPLNPFSSMNFVYEQQQFNRLAKLVEFNTLLCIDTIKKVIEESVTRNKNGNQNRQNLTFSDVAKMMKHVTYLSNNTNNDGLKLNISKENEHLLKKHARSSEQPALRKTRPPPPPPPPPPSPPPTTNGRQRAKADKQSYWSCAHAQT
ncbi:cytosolic phospholipase A2 [Procambarus clarkii]|uniref:cytosolic phospholipase A2 n=1 Tax=Procambarus clarkii TaxID=6728 RepID=UPI003743E4EE